MKRTYGIVCVILSVIASAYTIWYMQLAPASANEGALSKIGLHHPILFAIWGVLTYCALCLNIVHAYKSRLKTRIHIPLLIISGIGMLLTLTNDFDFDKRLQYYLHCVGSLTFSVIMGIIIFILFLLCFKKGAIFKAFTIITGLILISDLVCLLIFKETGLIEALPIFAGYILLGITNIRSDKNEAKQEAGIA